jgi:hypothetical protein
MLRFIPCIDTGDLHIGHIVRSGIGFRKGILRGNCKNLTEIGYKGVVMEFNAGNIVAWLSIND